MTAMQLITHTPIWVWIIFFALIYLGGVQLKTRFVQPLRLLIFPIIFLPLSFMMMMSSPKVLLTISVFILCIGLSFYIAQLWFDKYPLITRNTQGQYLQRGSLLPLLLYLIIFIYRYIVIASQTIKYEFIHSTYFAVFMGMPIAISLGILLAMTLTVRTTK